MASALACSSAITSFFIRPSGTGYKYDHRPLIHEIDHFHFDFASPPSCSRRKHFRRCSVLPVLSSSSISDMDNAQGQGVYPQHRCKTIHLVRHAQGFHNVAGEKDHSAYLSPVLFDAQLTPLGWQQVDNLRNHIQATGLLKRVELVVVSPLLRTMQTAVGVFGGGSYENGVDAPPLMVENTGNCNRPAISSLNCPPFVAVELCREHLGVHWCDKRRSITEYSPLFPAIDFSLIESDDDSLWNAEVREPDADLAARGVKFFNWLGTRKEKEIAVVTHSGFLIHTLSSFGNDCHPSVKTEICRPFNNCELRSVVIVDRSMVGTSSSSTDFPGKIPQGLDAPSDEAEEKH
ncbi:phosphoglycerate mutase-like protein isoform X2 [Andrographis paniculata]|uniref:phosphoglycerate mutase-like protein isoform X2 n=1 Tax=Andrographis paniculata TaxID=175694 RepID=UPI0021E85AB8|nr:phosphoglycerate mutase-like protein isoform X2 [Andrographis paniculata]